MNFNTILIKIRFDWDRFGLKEKVTAANQLTDYVYDETGLLREILSKYGDRKNPDRSIAREYCSHSLILVVHPAYLTDSL